MHSGFTMKSGFSGGGGFSMTISGSFRFVWPSSGKLELCFLLNFLPDFCGVVYSYLPPPVASFTAGAAVVSVFEGARVSSTP